MVLTRFHISLITFILLIKIICWYACLSLGSRRIECIHRRRVFEQVELAETALRRISNRVSTDEARELMIKIIPVNRNTWRLCTNWSQSLASGYVRFNIKVIAYHNITIDGRDLEDSISVQDECDYILGVRTRSSGGIYYPGDWNNYRVNWGLKARLMDTKREGTGMTTSYGALENGDGRER